MITEGWNGCTFDAPMMKVTELVGLGQEAN
jgi:hypothetical protein